MLFPARLPRPLRLVLYALAVFVLLMMCVLPQDRLPETGTGDKPEHAIAWFILTITGYVLAPRRVWAIPTFALAFGILIEFLQATMGVGRHGEWRDFAVDAIGVALAALIYLSYRRWWPR